MTPPLPLSPLPRTGTNIYAAPSQSAQAHDSLLRRVSAGVRVQLNYHPAASTSHLAFKHNSSSNVSTLLCPRSTKSPMNT